MCTIYGSLFRTQKEKFGKYAAENRSTNAIHQFSKELLSLKESTVRGWKKAYLCELASKNRAGDKKMLVDRLPVAVKGRPLLLGKDLDLKV